MAGHNLPHLVAFPQRPTVLPAAKPPGSTPADEDFILRDLLNTCLGASMLLRAGAESHDLDTWQALASGLANALLAAAERARPRIEG